MKRQEENQFKTYRRQAHALRLDDETRNKIIRTIQAMEEEKAAIEAAGATEETMKIVQTTSTREPPEKRWRARTPGVLKVAACLALVLGVGMFSVAAPVAYETATHTAEKASAGSPLRPYQRIELDESFFACMESEPPYREAQEFDPAAQYQCGMQARLFLPGIDDEECEVLLAGAPGVRVCGEDVATLDMDAPSQDTLAVASRESNYLFNIVWPIKMTEEKFEGIFGDVPNFSWDSREPAALIDSLRDARLVVRVGGDTHVYRFDFGDLADAEAIREEFAREYRPVILSLVEEGE